METLVGKLRLLLLLFLVAPIACDKKSVENTTKVDLLSSCTLIATITPALPSSEIKIDRPIPFEVTASGCPKARYVFERENARAIFPEDGKAIFSDLH